MLPMFPIVVCRLIVIVRFVSLPKLLATQARDGGYVA